MGSLQNTYVIYFSFLDLFIATQLSKGKINISIRLDSCIIPSSYLEIEENLKFPVI